jgi:selenocysteine-specific elongation factor
LTLLNGNVIGFADVPSPEEQLFRLTVYRCFTLPGTGTVVTGAVLSGLVVVDDWEIVSPQGLEARVRSIHAQNRAVTPGQASDRCALNLAGDAINTRVIARGDMVVDTRAHAPTSRIDAEVALLAAERRPLEYWTPVRLYHSAAEAGVRIALLHDTAISPGDQGLVQLVPDVPIAAAAGDRSILRDTSGNRTLGGGRLLDIRGPARRRK